MTITTAQAPFRTKADVRRAMTVGSRWRVTYSATTCPLEDCPDGCIYCEGCPEACRAIYIEEICTVVRASTTSRWVTSDQAAPGASPIWVGVDGKNAKYWVVTPRGFKTGGTGTGWDAVPEEVWELVETGPSNVSTAA